ncbi:hypothetical protein SCP_0601850 [Sparassis crispa]|uniref:T6SS Phospholipase effector Tle1-like catalytic domain-containing protein n=1 Tax=Sparassis crispa TaxID=139825 RepID=A0A401GPR0_9APHY|nr:hypothetical protein SCP_0601850 [Sparassis crispa]GBE84207.1 hypothetical protein SCP_0601850 [Sparassis crispa]
MTSKTLLVFCDGTGMDGQLSQSDTGARAGGIRPDDVQVLFDKPDAGKTAPKKDEPPVRGGTGNQQYASNVLRLSRSVLPRTKDGKPQIVFYQSGVGAETDFEGSSDLQQLLAQMTGVLVASKIRDAYAFIAQNYEDGDDICIFGFSRGAYTARKLAGLIDLIGLLTRTSMGLFFTIWRALVDGKKPDIPSDTRRVRIKCVAVWDTVGSVLNTIDALSIKDTSLPPTIDVALHALSLQENRQKFLPTLWTVPKRGLNRNQIFKQVWFPGAHSDVGGGYARHELADLALFWIAGEIESFVNLDLAFVQRSGQPKPEQWGTSQPHNAYEELSFAAQIVIQHETRLESKQIDMTSIFHPSLKVAPSRLDDPRYMITLETVQQAFGSSFVPQYASLNKFEQKCKDQWGKTPYSGPSQIPVFENPGQLFGAPVGQE